MPKDAQGRRSGGLLLLGKPGFTPQRFLLKNLCGVPTWGANFGHTTVSRLLSASFRRFDLRACLAPLRITPPRAASLRRAGDRGAQAGTGGGELCAVGGGVCCVAKDKQHLRFLAGMTGNDILFNAISCSESLSGHSLCFLLQRSQLHAPECHAHGPCMKETRRFLGE